MRRTSIELLGLWQHWQLLVLVVACLYLTPATPLSAQDNAPEYAVKAHMINQFTAFLEWPKSKLDKNQDLIVGILGKTPLLDHTDEIDGVKVKTPPHTLRVRKLQSIDEARACHIVFIDGNDAFVKEAAEGLAREGIITIGESKAFEEAGGMIRFMIKSKNVRFKINAKQAKLSGVIVSSKLLSLSEK